MAKLTDGSENEVADNEFEAEDPFLSDDDNLFSSGDEFVKRDDKLKRNLAEGRNLNNSFGHYDASDWEHLHIDKGANPQFKALKIQPARFSLRATTTAAQWSDVMTSV